MPLLGDLPVTGELLAVVRGQGVHPVTVRPQAPQQGLGHRRYGLAAQQLQDRVPGGPVHRGQQGTPVPRADDRVQLPVPDPALLLHHRRTLGKVHPPRNVPPPGMPPALPVRLPAAPPEVQVQVSSLLAVRPHPAY